MTVDPRTPCIIGAAQQTWHPGADAAPEPLAMWETVLRAAATDTGAADPAAVLGRAGSLEVLYCQSWPYDDPAGRLAAALGIDPPRRVYTGIGGTTPHLMLERAARAVAAGDLDAALVVGGEALHTVRQAKKAETPLAWSHRDPEKKPFPYEAPFHPAEVAHEVFQAWLTFAVFDVARMARTGLGREDAAAVLAPMSEVAAGNPNAWFHKRWTAAELAAPTPENRLVGWPYTKGMVSVMDIDMAAGLIVASAGTADELGVPEGRRVYIRGAAYAEDPVYVAEHPEMWRSPGMAAAWGAAAAEAGCGIDDVAHLDLYSCFASSVSFACDAIGIAAGDTRPLTVTGGLPFFGGPGSGYGLHAAATLVETLRGDPGSLGVTSGVGMHMTKHAYLVASTTPPARALSPEPVRPVVEDTPLAIADTHDGPAAVAAYSVVHDRSGAATWGLAVCDVAPGVRAYARAEDPEWLAAAEAELMVGAEVRITTDGTVNRLTA